MATTLASGPQQLHAEERVSDFRRNASLTLELAVTSFKLKYTGSVLGYVWSFLKPMFLFGTTYFVFIYIFKVDGGANAGTEFGSQLLVGIVLWTFFAEATGSAIASIAANGALIRKAWFPRVILVVSSTLTALLTFVINIALVIVVTTLLGHLHPGLRTLVLPLLLVQLYVLVLGISLLLASMFVYFRDIGHLWEIFSQLLFYGSAVVFPVSILHGAFLPRLIGMNPVAQIIADTRAAVVIRDPRVPWMLTYDGWTYAVPLVLTLGVLALGTYVFRRLSPRFAEAL